jgi:hypothetical protein
MPIATPGSQKQVKTVRLPLVGVANNRQYTQLTTASGVVGIGVVGSMIVGNIIAAGGDQRFINVIFDSIKNPVTGNKTTYVSKRPGFASHITPASGQFGSALRAWARNSDKLISAFGSLNSTIYDGTTSLGAITGVAKFIDELEVGSTSTLGISSTDNTLWYLQPAGVPILVADADFPGNAGLTITGRCISMNGYNFIMTTDGKIYNSDLNSITSWQSTSFLSAQMYPDAGIGLARYKNQIVALGKETLEFFHITDNSTGSPLAPTDQGFIRLGCASQYGYTVMEDTFAWCSATDRGGVSVYMLDGFQAKKVSNPQIDSQLAIAGPNTLRINCLKVFGKTLIIVHANSICFVYDVEDEIWCEWSSTTSLWYDITCTIGSDWRVYSISNVNTSGKIFIINPTQITYQDNSLSYSMLIQTSKVDFGTTKRKFYHRLTVVGDRPTTSAVSVISWSDDDYRSFFSGYALVLTDNRAHLTRMGSAFRRSWVFFDNNNMAVRLEALELDYTEAGK